jgi:hypothetical protein
VDRIGRRAGTPWVRRLISKAGRSSRSSSARGDTSPTFRQQCARLAGVPELRITVRVDLQRARSGSRAYTTMARRNGRLTSADVVLLVPVDTMELIAHEIEHVIEQLDGVEPYRDACAGSRNPSRGYESCRALEMGRRVAREVKETERTRVLGVRQRDPVSAPLDPATASISASGRFVAFISAARLLPASHKARHLHVLDLETGRLDLESARPGWPGPADAFSTPRISADGSVLVVDIPTWEGTSHRPDELRLRVEQLAHLFQVVCPQRQCDRLPLRRGVEPRVERLRQQLLHLRVAAIACNLDRIIVHPEIQRVAIVVEQEANDVDVVLAHGEAVRESARCPLPRVKMYTSLHRAHR